MHIHLCIVCGHFCTTTESYIIVRKAYSLKILCYFIIWLFSKKSSLNKGISVSVCILKSKLAPSPTSCMRSESVLLNTSETQFSHL